jgi:HD-like signal output (HDOD) protein/CheY-like chemotaxis protein
MNCSLHALVVDDDDAVRSLTVKMLASQDIVCDEARDGEQAIELLGRGTYDVLVTDLRMPRRHGHSLAVEVLARGATRPVVVVLTGVLEPRLAADLIARGIDDIAFKPVDYRLFAAKVRALCVRRQREREAAGQQNEPAAAPASAYESPIALEQFEQRLDALAGTLPVSQAAMELVNVLQGGTTSIEQVARVLARDPILTVEILRLANSAHYNPAGKRVDDLQDAVARVGDRQISEVALAYSTLHSLAAVAPKWINAETVWRRCLANSLIIKELHPAADVGADDESLFISSLLLPMSRLVLGLAFPALYDRLVARCHQTGASLASLERHWLPMPPARAMAGMLARWNLSPRLFKPLQHAALSFHELTTMGEPLRSKVERLRLAELLGQLTVGRFEPWEEIDLPLSETMSRLRAEDLFVLLGWARQNMADLGAGTAAARQAKLLRYCRLGTESYDLVALLFDGLGLRVERIQREDALASQPAVVSCLDASPDRLEWFLDNAVPDSGRTLICSRALPPHYESWGPLVQLPCSFASLEAAIAAAFPRG